MIELIFLAILISTFLGIAIILLRKIPVLVKLPETPASKKSLISKESLILKLKEGIKNLPGSEKFNYELYLQKILSKIRILTLKTESKTGSWLERLRQKAIQRNNHHKDNYWEKLKKAKNKK